MRYLNAGNFIINTLFNFNKLIKLCFNTESSVD